MNRRGFLKALGAGAAASVVTLAPGGAGGAAAESITAAGRARSGPGPRTFGRMFPSLPPFASPGPALTEALLDLGRPGGCWMPLMTYRCLLWS